MTYSGWQSISLILLAATSVACFLLYYFRQIYLKKLQEELLHWKNNYFELDTSYAKIVSHTNRLQEEIESLLDANKLNQLDIDTLKLQLSQLHRDKAYILKEYHSLKEQQKKEKKWQDQWHVLRQKADQLAKDKTDLAQIAGELQKTIVLLQRKIQEKKRKKEKTATIDKVLMAATEPVDGLSQLLNFKRPGNPASDNRDNLKLINGIGNFIEQQLNERGIFRFDQIAKFSKEDIEEFTRFIPLNPGQIEEQDWVGQAQRFK